MSIMENSNPYYEDPFRMMGECFNPNLSIFIPIIYKNSNTKNFIKNTLYEKKIGLVYHIDLKRTKNNNNKWCAFVYIRWYTNELTINIQNELIGNDKSYKFDYTENNYWIFLKNKNPITEEKMIQQEENLLKKKIIKMNREYLQKIDYYSKIAEENINNINCEKRTIYISEYYIYWDNDRIQYIPSIRVIKK